MICCLGGYKLTRQCPLPSQLSGIWLLQLAEGTRTVRVEHGLIWPCSNITGWVGRVLCLTGIWGVSWRNLFQPLLHVQAICICLFPAGSWADRAGHTRETITANSATQWLNPEWLMELVGIAPPSLKLEGVIQSHECGEESLWESQAVTFSYFFFLFIIQ